MTPRGRGCRPRLVHWSLPLLHSFVLLLCELNPSVLSFANPLSCFLNLDTQSDNYFFLSLGFQSP